MKFRILTVLAAAGALTVVGCGDDITNIIEQVPPPVATDTPGNQVPTDTPVVGPPTATPTAIITTCRDAMDGEAVICGDGECVAPELCDIGGICVGGTRDLEPCSGADECGGGRCTVVGGQNIPASDDSCSANCTIESRRTGIYSDEAGALVQALALGVPVALNGSQTIQTGTPRDDDTIDINGDTTFHAGDLPMVTKAPDIRIEPAQVLGLVCACVRGIPVPQFGAGNAATGLISCGGPLDLIDVTISQDHHTDPLDDFETVDGCALPPDPECDDTNNVTNGVTSRPCREGEDEDCSDISTNRHLGVCNSARLVEYAGNAGPAGSAIIFNNTAIGLLSDRGECNLGVGGMDPCPFADYGPDCIPCTDDDLDLGVPENNPTTTGVTTSRVFNASNRPGSVITQSSNTPCTTNDDCNIEVCGESEVCLSISETESICGVRCGGSGPCQTTATGSAFSCEELMANPEGGLSGGTFAVTFPSIDAATIGDNVTSVLFAFE